MAAPTEKEKSDRLIWGNNKGLIHRIEPLTERQSLDPHEVLKFMLRVVDLNPNNRVSIQIFSEIGPRTLKTAAIASINDMEDDAEVTDDEFVTFAKDCLLQMFPQYATFGLLLDAVRESVLHQDQQGATENISDLFTRFQSVLNL